MRLLISIPVLLLLWLAGCANYQLGNNVELPFKSVYVKPVVNHSFAPQAEVSLTQQVTEDLVRSGQVKTTTESSADTTLEIILIDYQRGVTATSARDTQSARAFSLTLTALVTFKNNRTGEVYIDQREITATQQAFTEGGFIQSEYQAMPILTRNLADMISGQVLSAW